MPIHNVRGAHQDPSGRVPVHQLGFITIGATEYPLVDCGAWSGSRASYVEGSIVTDSGVQYLCILAHTASHEPPNGTYWERYEPAKRFLRADRTWSKSAGIANDWMQASQGFTAANDAGAPSSPSWTDVPFSSLDRTSDDAGDVYVPTVGGVDYIAVRKPGGYLLTLVASFPEGLNNYIACGPNISGDAWLGVSDNAGYIPASYPGNVGGGVVVYRQPFAVEETALLGGVHEVAIFGRVWQNSGSSRDGNLTLFIERLT